MINIKDNFNEWFRDVDKHHGFSAYTRDAMILAYQAAHESAETTLTAQALAITQLESRCKELEDALQFYAQLDWKVNTDFWQSRAKQALSTKSPTGKEVG